MFSLSATGLRAKSKNTRSTTTTTAGVRNNTRSKKQHHQRVNHQQQQQQQHQQQQVNNPDPMNLSTVPSNVDILTYNHPQQQQQQHNSAYPAASHAIGKDPSTDTMITMSLSRPNMTMSPAGSFQSSVDLNSPSAEAAAATVAASVKDCSEKQARKNRLMDQFQTQLSHSTRKQQQQIPQGWCGEGNGEKYEENFISCCCCPFPIFFYLPSKI